MKSVTYRQMFSTCLCCGLLLFLEVCVRACLCVFSRVFVAVVSECIYSRVSCEWYVCLCEYMYARVCVCMLVYACVHVARVF